MKNLKKLFLVPVLALGTISSCYGKNDTTCPEEKKCDACPTPSDQPSSETEVSKEGHTLSVAAKEVKLLVDENIGKVKHIVATASPSTDTLTYVSSDTSVAEVSSSGVITGKKANAYCVVTVKSSAGLQIDIAVNTYETAGYFNFSGAVLTGINDHDVEELVLPTVNPIDGTALTSVGDNADFYGLVKLKKLSVPEGYTYIGDYAFAACTSLEELYLPSTLSSIISTTFIGTGNTLRKVEVAEQDTKNTALMVSEPFELGNNSQVLYSRNDKVVFLAFNNPNGVLFDETLALKSIHYFAYYGINSLKDIVIPGSVQTIRRYAFAYNDNLESVEIGANTNTIEPGSFMFLPKFKRVNVDNDNPNFTSRAVADDGTTIDVNAIIYLDNAGAGLRVSTSNPVLSEGNKYFNSSKTDKTLITINQYSVVGTGIVDFYIPSTVTTVSEASFWFNSNLSTVYIPNSVTQLPSKILFTLQKNNVGQFLEFYDRGGMWKSSHSDELGRGKVLSVFAGCNTRKLTLYYQTIDENHKELVSKFANVSTNIDGSFYTKEVKDASLADPE